MHNIIYNDNIITPKNNIHTYYYQFIRKLNKIDCVKLSLFCAKIINNNTKDNNDCIELVEKWLKNQKPISNEELLNIANINYNPISTINLIFSNTLYSIITPTNATTNIISSICSLDFINIINDNIILYLKTLLRTTKQYNTKIHNNQHYESILKEIIKEDIDKLTDTDYNMLIDLSQEYYNINPNITNKRIFVELLRREYEWHNI